MDWKSLANKLPEGRRRNLFWLLTLLSVLPAARSQALFPTDWFPQFTDTFLISPVDNVFGWLAIPAGFLVLTLAPKGLRTVSLFAVSAYALVFLANLELTSGLSGLHTAYAIVALVVFAGFVFQGRANTGGFAIFALLAILLERFDDLLTMPSLLVFFGVVLVGRIVVEAIRQNLALFKQLGRSNLWLLVSKTALLWWPMMILIGIGIWLGGVFSTATENALYDGDLIAPYCELDGIDDTIINCSRTWLRLAPDDPIELRVEELWRQPVPDDPDYQPRCRLKYFMPYETSVARLNGPEFVCPEVTETTTAFSLTRRPFFDSAYRSVNRDYDEVDWKISHEVNRMRAKRKLAISDARRRATDLFDVVPKTTGMRKRDCEFLEVKCTAGNYVIGELNRAYIKKRGEARTAYVGELSDIETAAGGKTGVFLNDSEIALLARAKTSRDLTLAAVGRIEKATNLLGRLLQLLLIVAIVKSLLYVFSRVIFDKSTAIEVDMLDDDVSTVQGHVRHLQEVEIAPDYPFHMYYKSNYQPLGPAARFSIPQWAKSWFARIRYGAWNMSKASMPLPDNTGLTFNAIEAEHLVDWDMAEGEEVVFSYGNFVAINENVELNTVISLRVSTLLLGRIVFHTAKCVGGPGRLILRTRGKPATSAQVRQSIPASRLIAWNRNARFSVDSHLTPQDVFLNGFNLSRSEKEDAESQGILVVEADARGGGLMVGTLRFARNFILPI